MLTPLPPEGARLVREVLIGAGYTHEQFRRNPALREIPSRRLGNLPALLERTRDPSLLNALIRLYFLGVPYFYVLALVTAMLLMRTDALVAFTALSRALSPERLS